MLKTYVSDNRLKLMPCVGMLLFIAPTDLHGQINNLIYNFTGSVSYFEDPNGDLTHISIGDAVEGTFGYDVNAEGEDLFGDGSLFYFQSPPAPELSFTVGGVTFRSVGINHDFGGQLMDVVLDGFFGDEFSLFQFAEMPDGVTAFKPDMLLLMASNEPLPDASLPSEINLSDWFAASISFQAYANENYNFEDPYDITVIADIESLELASQEPMLGGDYNNNGTVEQADLDLVLLHWGSDAAAVPDTWTNDLPTGTIDQEELDSVLLHWGDTDGLAAASVPEPNVAALLFLAVLAGFVMLRRE